MEIEISGLWILILLLLWGLYYGHRKISLKFLLSKLKNDKEADSTVSDSPNAIREGIYEMIDDLRSIPGASLSRDGCLEIVDHIDEVEERLKSVLAAYNELDYAFCTFMQRGESGLGGKRYQELEDIVIEAQEFLGIEEDKYL
jgi:hypothetical protein